MRVLFFALARSRALTAILVAVLLAAACERQEPVGDRAATPTSPAPVPATDETHPAGIDWYAGDVDAAFAAARTQNKPLYLYWGAEWCPPCAQIKATIFNRREFQERSQLFVPVYLDGDTPGAQKQAARFGVVGYPTMILFRPDGTEITRLPGGVDVARYASILDAALGDARPVAQILDAVRKGEPISADDWHLLAYFSPTSRGAPTTGGLCRTPTRSRRSAGWASAAPRTCLPTARGSFSIISFRPHRSPKCRRTR
jgi:thioredoxin-related protein